MPSKRPAAGNADRLWEGVTDLASESELRELGARLAALGSRRSNRDALSHLRQDRTAVLRREFHGGALNDLDTIRVLCETFGWLQDGDALIVTYGHPADQSPGH